MIPLILILIGVTCHIDGPTSRSPQFRFCARNDDKRNDQIDNTPIRYFFYFEFMSNFSERDRKKLIIHLMAKNLENINQTKNS